MNWDQKLDVLMKETGLSICTVSRLRREAGFRPDKPFRNGRRKFSYADFPGVDWSESLAVLKLATGLSYPTLIRMRREWSTLKSH